MSWLWFAGPLVFLFCLMVISLWPTTEERRLRATLDRWIADYLGPLHDAKGKVKRRYVRAIPSVFNDLVNEVGGGSRVADVVLVSKQAYLVARAADAITSTNQVTILFKLAEPAPRFTCKPVPIVDGRPADNKGITFKKDPYFGEAFWVDGAEPKTVTKWLRKAIRRRLMEVPEAWLRVRGKTAALTLYSGFDEAALDALVDAADEIFAEYGTDPEASLFGEGEPGKRKAKKVAKGKDEGAAASFQTRLRAGAVDVGLYVIALFLVALTSGEIAAFHDASFGSTFFNSPDISPTEPWQGGWTTKGFGIFVAAESLLACLFVLQTYWVSVHGQTIGKRIFGARIERDGEAPGFWRGIVLRSWIFALIPLGVAAAVAIKPLTAAAFFAAIPSRVVMGVAAGLVLVGAGTLQMAASSGQSLRDKIAGTRVVEAEPLRLPSVQLDVGGGTDPIALRRVYIFGGLVALFVVANVAAAVADVSFWIY